MSETYTAERLLAVARTIEESFRTFNFTAIRAAISRQEVTFMMEDIGERPELFPGPLGRLARALGSVLATVGDDAHLSRERRLRLLDDVIAELEHGSVQLASRFHLACREALATLGPEKALRLMHEAMEEA